MPKRHLAMLASVARMGKRATIAARICQVFRWWSRPHGTWFTMARVHRRVIEAAVLFQLGCGAGPAVQPGPPAPSVDPTGIASATATVVSARSPTHPPAPVGAATAAAEPPPLLDTIVASADAPEADRATEPRAIPRVTVAEPTVCCGTFPQALIQRFVRRDARARIKACYRDMLVSAPDFSGRLTAKFVIQRDGTVDPSQTTVEGAAAHVDLQRCAADAFNGLVFPEPEGGIVTVTYPFMLKP